MQKFGPKNYTSASLGQLQALIRQALEENEDVYELIEERLTEWEERRPQKVAKKETVEASNVIAKYVFAAVGFTRLRWVNTGSDVCPIVKNYMVVSLELTSLSLVKTIV